MPKPIDSRDILDLAPEMLEKAELFLGLCKIKSLPVRIYCTSRSLETQAKLFRAGHTLHQIWLRQGLLNAGGYGFLSDILDEVGPQHSTSPVTQAGPGESWHNYGLAFDAVPMRGSECLWSVKDYPNEWGFFGDCVREAGLIWGGDWKYADHPHCQLHKERNPLSVYSPDECRKMLGLDS